MNLPIRSAQPRDHPAIRAIVATAFGRTDEAGLVGRLRADGDVLFELVSGDATAVHGHALAAGGRVRYAKAFGV